MALVSSESTACGFFLLLFFCFVGKLFLFILPKSGIDNGTEWPTIPACRSLKPVLNWANVCSPEHTSDTSKNYDSFLN